MKTIIATLVVLTFSFFGPIRAADPVYLDVISDISKTTNFTIGIYPLKLTNEVHKTYLTMYLVNDGKEDLIWTRMNRILIVLKDNTLAYNYNTTDDSGNYSCAYIVGAGKTLHEQTLCFDSEFTANDIANVYLLEGGNVYKLDYYNGE